MVPELRMESETTFANAILSISHLYLLSPAGTEYKKLKADGSSRLIIEILLAFEDSKKVNFSVYGIGVLLVNNVMEISG